MVAPWDSHRSSPQDWNSDDEVAGGKDVFSDPPQPPNDDEFPTPGVVDDETGFELPVDPPEQGVGNNGEKEGHSKSRSYPAALFAVAACVAVLVFLGLRLVNVNFGSNSELASETEQLIDGGATETVPVGSTQTTLGSIASGETNWDDIARSVVYFEVGGGCQWVGSGTLILDGSYVLTNWHVSGGGECPIRVGFTDNVSKPPTDFYTAEVVCWDSQIDLAIVQLKDSSGAPYIPPGRKPVTIASSEIRLGEAVRILGYPVVREDQFEAGERYTLTLTDGVISGAENFGERPGYKPTDSRNNEYEVWGDYFKHTAKQNGGVSGGGAFNAAGQLVGIPTAGSDNLELMRPVRFANVLIGQTE